MTQLETNAYRRFDHCAGVDVARQIETFRPREELVAPEIHKLAWN